MTTRESTPGLFAVVIAYYQREGGLLTRAVRSALAQKVPNLRVFVVDDASPLPAREELAGLDPGELGRVRILERPNGGPAQARNTALNALPENTRYVAFLDSDDAWSPDHLGRAALVFERGFEIYFSNWIPLESPEDAYTHFQRKPPLGGELLPDSALYAYAGDFLGQELSQPLARLSTLVYDFRRFPDVRFEENLRWASEDRLFRAQLAIERPRIALSLRPECTSGEGVNIFSGSLWGTEAFFETVSDQVSALRMARKSLPLDKSHKRIVREALATAREDLVSSWLHFARRHPIRGLDRLGHLTARDLALYYYVPVGFLKAIFGRGKRGAPARGAVQG